MDTKSLQNYTVNVRAIVHGDLTLLKDMDINPEWDVYDFDEDLQEQTAVMRADCMVQVQARTVAEAVFTAKAVAPGIGFKSSLDMANVTLWVDEDMDIATEGQ